MSRAEGTSRPVGGSRDNGTSVQEFPQVESRETVMTALGDLQVAQEELRVAEEEIRAQQGQIEDLIAEYASGERWREHLLSLLPVGVLVTDGRGTVRETNAAAADLLGVRAARLIGKPLPSYVELDDRAAVRGMVGRLARESTEERLGIVLRPRNHPHRRAEVVGLRDEDDPPDAIRWVIIPRNLDDAAALPAQDGLPSSAEEGEDPDEALEAELRTATALARLYSLPVEEQDQQRLLSRMAVAVRSAVSAATAVSVTLGPPTAPDRTASDSTDAQRFDGLQFRLGEGPSVDAYEREVVVVTPDVTEDPRWPRLAPRSRGQGLLSVLAIPLQVANCRAGVINIYAAGGSAFPARAQRLGELVAAAVAAVLEASAERASLQSLVHHLERALNSRAVIEQAKGIVMAHQGGTAEEAFAKLVAFSSRNNVKLRDVATLIVEGGGRTPLHGL